VLLPPPLSAMSAAAVLLHGGGDQQDILDRFASVTSAGRVVVPPPAQSEGWTGGVGWRDGGEEREDIRRELALEREDLEICFVNEIASDEESWDIGGPDHNTVAHQIARSNISQKAGQIIVPIEPICSPGQQTNPASRPLNSDRQLGRVVSDNHGHSSDGQARDKRLCPLSSSHQTFRDKVASLQVEARRGLICAPSSARMQMEERGETKLLSPELASLVGLGNIKSQRLNRRMLTSLSLGQLQVILNHFLAQIEDLNESLVKELLARDERVMEQDAMLTDIGDLDEFVNLKL